MLVPPDNFGLVEPGLYRCSKLEHDNFPFLETLGLKSILLLDAENPPRALKNFIATNQIDLINLGGLKITNHNHTGTNNNNAKDEDDKNSISGRSIRRASNSSSSSRGSLSDSNSNSNSRLGSRLGSQNASPTLLAQPSFSSSVSASKEINLQLINLNNTTKKNDQWMLIEKNLIKKAFEILLDRLKYNILVVDSTSTLVSILRRIQKWNFNSIVNEFRIYNGNSAKSNYFAENFLELIEIELVPFEIDQLNQAIKQQQHQKDEALSKSPEIFRTNSWGLHKNSIDDETAWDVDASKEILDDDEIDDDLLSASPQIPENLLKIVEKKRSNLALELSDDDKLITPGTSPRHIASNSSPLNDTLSMASRQNWEKRRPSMDTAKIMRPIHNTMFRSSFSTSNFQLPHSNRSSFEGLTSPGLRKLSRSERKPSLKMDDINDSEEKRVRERYDFKYYKNLNKYSINFDNVSYIRMKLPPSNKLPDWFVKGRDYWEHSYKQFNAYS